VRTDQYTLMHIIAKYTHCVSQGSERDACDSAENDRFLNFGCSCPKPLLTNYMIVFSYSY
jgi:hypothetical protein